MMARVTVCLEEHERTVLQQMSELDCRPPRDQIRFLVRAEASRRGLIDGPVVGLKEKAAFRSDKQTRDDQDSASTPES